MGEHTKPDEPLPPRPRVSKLTGWVPFALVVCAIMAVAGAGIDWVVTPHGSGVTMAAPRNVGVVPTNAKAAAVLVDPNMIEIPRLSAKASVVNVNTLATGELDVPLNPKVVGWWDGGARPGAPTGTAILDGHINYAGVEGVLSKINTLNPGDVVFVDGTYDGQQTQVKFTITGVQTYSKTALPYAQIFDQKVAGRLAIVTCGGPFDAKTHNYLDNIVAFAVPA